jgi:hypothetical protein
MWLATVPERRKDLERRLLSDHPKDSYAALWELMWRVAANRRWKLASRSTLNGKTPDLLIERPSAFALEVLTVREMWIHRHTTLATELLEALDDVPTDRLWALHITSTVPYRYDIPEAVERFRAGVIRTLPSGARRILCDDAGVIQVEPLLTRAGGLTGVHVTDYGARWMSNDDLLSEKIDEKARTYPPSVLGNRPLVIAVCVAPEYGISVRDMGDALFGRIRVNVAATIAARAAEGGLQSERGGGWFLTEGRSHVAAIIFATQVSYTPLTANAYVFTNPYAERPLTMETFLPWPTTRWDEVRHDEATGNWEGSDETVVLR